MLNSIYQIAVRIDGERHTARPVFSTRMVEIWRRAFNIFDRD